MDPTRQSIVTATQEPISLSTCPKDAQMAKLEGNDRPFRTNPPLVVTTDAFEDVSKVETDTLDSLKELYQISHPAEEGKGGFIGTLTSLFATVQAEPSEEDAVRDLSRIDQILIKEPRLPQHPSFLHMRFSLARHIDSLAQSQPTTKVADLAAQIILRAAGSIPSSKRCFEGLDYLLSANGITDATKQYEIDQEIAILVKSIKGNPKLKETLKAYHHMSLEPSELSRMSTEQLEASLNHTVQLLAASIVTNRHTGQLDNLTIGDMQTYGHAYHVEGSTPGVRIPIDCAAQSKFSLPTTNFFASVAGFNPFDFRIMEQVVAKGL